MLLILQTMNAQLDKFVLAQRRYHIFIFQDV